MTRYGLIKICKVSGQSSCLHFQGRILSHALWGLVYFSHFLSDSHHHSGPFLTFPCLHFPLCSHTLIISFSAPVSTSCANLWNSRFLQNSPNTKGYFPALPRHFTPTVFYWLAYSSWLCPTSALYPLCFKCVLFIYPRDGDTSSHKTLSNIHQDTGDYITQGKILPYCIHHWPLRLITWGTNHLSQHNTHYCLRCRNLFLYKSPPTTHHPSLFEEQRFISRLFP